MQPRTLALLITLLPLLTVNAAYLMSLAAGHVAACLPYLQGCTTISQAGRSGDTLFFFRALMMVYAVLLALFWLFTLRWLEKLEDGRSSMATIIAWVGVIGALFLILYLDYLGTQGEMQRFLRRYGILIHFSFTPLAQLLLLYQLYRIRARNGASAINARVLDYQRLVLLLVLALGLVSVYLGYSGKKTYQSENIVEWNYSLLLALYFAGMIRHWWRLRFELR